MAQQHRQQHMCVCTDSSTATSSTGQPAAAERRPLAGQDGISLELSSCRLGRTRVPAHPSLSAWLQTLRHGHGVSSMHMVFKAPEPQPATSAHWNPFQHLPAPLPQLGYVPAGQLPNFQQLQLHQAQTLQRLGPHTVGRGRTTGKLTLGQPSGVAACPSTQG